MTPAASGLRHSWLARAASLGILLCGVAAVSFVANSLWNRAQSAQKDRGHEIRMMADSAPPEKLETTAGEIAEHPRITRHPATLPNQEAPVAVPAVYRKHHLNEASLF